MKKVMLMVAVVALVSGVQARCASEATLKDLVQHFKKSGMPLDKVEFVNNLPDNARKIGVVEAMNVQDDEMKRKNITKVVYMFNVVRQRDAESMVDQLRFAEFSKSPVYTNGLFMLSLPRNTGMTSAITNKIVRIFRSFATTSATVSPKTADLVPQTPPPGQSAAFMAMQQRQADYRTLSPHYVVIDGYLKPIGETTAHYVLLKPTNRHLSDHRLVMEYEKNGHPIVVLVDIKSESASQGTADGHLQLAVMKSDESATFQYNGEERTSYVYRDVTLTSSEIQEFKAKGVKFKELGADTPGQSLEVSGPKTFVDETKGWAGMEPVHNVYPFQVGHIGKKATFRFWAAGDVGTDASGQVVMRGPDGQERVIYLWKPSDFKVAAKTVSSYKQLNPISCDVSSFVKEPGEYRFGFNWGGSPVGLTILRVELVVQ